MVAYSQGKVNFSGLEYVIYIPDDLLWQVFCGQFCAAALPEKYFKSSSHASLAQQPLIEVEGWTTTPFFWGLEVFFNFVREMERWRRLI